MASKGKGSLCGLRGQGSPDPPPQGPSQAPGGRQVPQDPAEGPIPSGPPFPALSTTEQVKAQSLFSGAPKFSGESPNGCRRNRALASQVASPGPAKATGGPNTRDQSADSEGTAAVISQLVFQKMVCSSLVIFSPVHEAGKKKQFSP